MFEHARLKLTFWYLIIIMAVSLLFSLSIYSRINADLSHFEQMQTVFERDITAGRIRVYYHPEPRLSVSEIQEARGRLILTLTFINLLILIFAGTAGYFLAGRTLKPISDMMEEQNRFITDSSHELRTPLTSLRSEIEVSLRNKKITTLQSRKVLQSNLEEVIGLQLLSENLLELSQNGTPMNKNLMEIVALTPILLTAVKKVEGLAKAKQIKIEVKTEDAKVKGIPDRLTEMFVILLDNAVKYSPKKSVVELKSRKTDGKIYVSITDHGAGIDKKDLPYIFDRFYRADKSRAENGYGLGLSIARKIAKLHEATLFVKSIPNKETEFRVGLNIIKSK